MHQILRLEKSFLQTKSITSSVMCWLLWNYLGTNGMISLFKTELVVSYYSYNLRETERHFSTWGHCTISLIF